MDNKHRYFLGAHGCVLTGSSQEVGEWQQVDLFLRLHRRNREDDKSTVQIIGMLFINKWQEERRSRLHELRDR